MKQSGRKAGTEPRDTFIEVSPKTAPAWVSQADFIREVKPYPTSARVQPRAPGAEVKVMSLQCTIRCGPIRQHIGWQMRLSKLDKLIAKRRQS